MYTPTEADFDIIDLLLQRENLSPGAGKQPPWYTSVLGDPVPELAPYGVKGYGNFPRLHNRSVYTRSKWLAVETVKGLRLVPELHFRALTLGHKLSINSHVSWKDGEESGLIYVEEREEKAGAGGRGPRLSKYGHAPGTRAYAREWRKQNQHRVLAANRKYQEKVKQALAMTRVATTATAAATPTAKAAKPAPLSPVEELALRIGVDLRAVKQQAQPAPQEKESETLAVSPKDLQSDEVDEVLPPCPRCGTDLGENGVCGFCGWEGEVRCE